MSRMDAPNETLSAAERAGESRDALVSAAAGNERRNRPVYLVAVAVVLLAACLVSLAASLWAVGTASREFSRERAAATTLASAVGRLKELEGQAGGGEKGPAPNDKILTMLQGAAERAGLENSKTLMPRPSPPENRGAGVQRVKFEYDAVRNEELEPLLLWLRYATEDIQGIEVYSVTLRPDANAWIMKVVFQRWQRAGS